MKYTLRRGWSGLGGVGAPYDRPIRWVVLTDPGQPTRDRGTGLLPGAPAIPHRPEGRCHDARRDTCYYDGHCGMCRRSTRILRRLDWLGNLAFEDLTKVPPTQLPVPMEAAMQGMPMRTRDGRVLVGFPAVRRALLRTPLGCLPAATLYIPGISHIARRVYGVIARNRSRQCVIP